MRSLGWPWVAPFWISELSSDLITTLNTSRDTPAPGPSLVTQQALAGGLERSPGPAREPRCIYVPLPHHSLKPFSAGAPPQPCRGCDCVWSFSLWKMALLHGDETSSCATCTCWPPLLGVPLWRHSHPLCSFPLTIQIVWWVSLWRLSHLLCRVERAISFHLPSQGRFPSPLNVAVALLWNLSWQFMSFLTCRNQNWT